MVFNTPQVKKLDMSIKIANFWMLSKILNLIIIWIPIRGKKIAFVLFVQEVLHSINAL